MRQYQVLIFTALLCYFILINIYKKLHIKHFQMFYHVKFIIIVRKIILCKSKILQEKYCIATFRHTVIMA